MIRLYLDDVRTPFDEGWTVVRNYKEFVTAIEEFGVPDLVSFDHDLAEEHMKDYFLHQYNGEKFIDYDSFKIETGRECVEYLINYCIRKNKPLKEVTVHSANELGSENIQAIVKQFQRYCGQEENCIRTFYPIQYVNDFK